jgi:hypothetical protein
VSFRQADGQRAAIHHAVVRPAPVRQAVSDDRGPRARLHVVSWARRRANESQPVIDAEDVERWSRFHGDLTEMVWSGTANWGSAERVDVMMGWLRKHGCFDRIQ